jgi:hypothetical protein
VHSRRSILDSVRGHWHWWMWLRATGLIRELPPLAGVSRSKRGSTGNTKRVAVRSLLHHLDGVGTITGWRLIWWRGISPGLGQFGEPGAADGMPAILCILRSDSLTQHAERT